MRFDFDIDFRAFYFVVEDVEEGEVAATEEAVPGLVFLELGAAGRLLGIEVFDPALIALVPVLLDAHGIVPPSTIRFGALAEALSRAVAPLPSREEGPAASGVDIFDE